MKNLRILFVLTLVFSSCSISSVDENRIRHNSWDYRNIPDSRNCGADESAEFTVAGGDTEIAPGVTVTFRADTNQFNFSSYKVQNLPERTTVRNFDFSSHDFVTLGMGKYIWKKNCCFRELQVQGFQK